MSFFRLKGLRRAPYGLTVGVRSIVFHALRRCNFCLCARRTAPVRTGKTGYIHEEWLLDERILSAALYGQVQSIVPLTRVASDVSCKNATIISYIYSTLFHAIDHDLFYVVINIATYYWRAQLWLTRTIIYLRKLLIQLFKIKLCIYRKYLRECNFRAIK